jgi:hypothetical protein
MDKLIFELIQRFEKLEKEVRVIRRELDAARALPARAQNLTPIVKLNEKKSPAPKHDREFYGQLLAQTLIDMGYSGG